MGDVSKPRRDSRGRFLPGVSGNPGGRRPNRHTLTSCLRRLAVEPVPGARGALTTRAEALAWVLWKAALEGDLQAAKVLLDRIDGCVWQADVEADDGPRLIRSPFALPNKAAATRGKKEAEDG